jgi:hypothetical protein
MTHPIKILPEYFTEVLNGNKTFELRKDDRGYNVGDILLLIEFDCGTYTGKQCRRTITYILRDAQQYGLNEGFAILAFNPKEE